MTMTLQLILIKNNSSVDNSTRICRQNTCTFNRVEKDIRNNKSQFF